MLIWLSILVAGSNSGSLKQGPQGQAGFLVTSIQEGFSGNQDALVARLNVSDDFLQGSPQQPLGSISLNGFSNCSACCNRKSGIWILPSFYY
jgi:hypothetical protein